MSTTHTKMLSWFHAAALVAVFTAAAVSSSTAATIQPLPDNPNIVELKNDLLTVRVDLARGARVASFLYKGFENQDVVFDYAASGGNGGLCKDLWTVQGWPGEFDKRKFESKIVSSGPGEVVLQAWTTSTGESRKGIDEKLSDLKLTKTFTLRQGDRALHLKVEIANNGSKGKRPAYWFQNAIDFDGERKHNLYWRPTRHAVDMISKGVESEYGYWYVAVPRAGWNGVTNAKLKRGIMFLMDYNSTQQLYDNCDANTLEWMYEDTAIPAGKTWITDITLIPTEGYAGYRYGDPDIVANFETAETPAGLIIEHVISAASAPLKNVTVKTKVIGAKDKWSAEAEPFTVPELGFAPLTRQVTVSGIGTLPCVVQVNVTGTDAQGKSKSISYEDYFGGKAGRNLNLEMLQPYYQFTLPPKVKKYLKPDVIKLQANAKPRILFVRGLWADFQGMDEALKTMGDVEVVNGWMKQAAIGETLGNFPASYEELLSYNTIILANVSGGMLGDLGQEMLADFAKAGGGILFLSGDRTYGQAGFSNTNFTPLIPATFKSGGDYARLNKPSALLPAKGSQPLVKGLKFPDSSVALYAHDITAATNAVPLLTYADGRPAALASAPGQPRVALVTPLPFGTAPSGQKLYFQDPSWQEFLARTVKWLTNTPSGKK
jgi:hypothetical protein